MFARLLRVVPVQTMRKSIELFHKRVILRKRECLLLFLFFQQVNRQQKSGEYIHSLYHSPPAALFYNQRLK
ncbi:hypothetical protein D3Z35_12850 [Enterococcus faecalis]|nr:hypothetical protein [Enterococcus faecalis]